MRLAFDVTEDDFWAGQEHLMFKSPEMKRYFRVTLGILGLALLVIMPLLTFFTTPARFQTPGLYATSFGSVIVGLLIGILILRFSTRLSRPVSRLFFRKLIDQATGHHELEIVPKGLHIYTVHGEQVIYWDSIGNIATSPEHTFIYLTRMQSVIVPQKRIQSGNYYAFMQAFADVYANRRDTVWQSSASAPTLTASPEAPPQVAPRNTVESCEPVEPAVQQVRANY